jgi:pSer/pThr/pTyr-binding forkhead associated (FHA) protein
VKDEPLAFVFCNKCGHRNPPESNFCSSCGAPLDTPAEEKTITFHPPDPALDAPGPADDVTVSLGDLPPGRAVLLVRAGSQAGLRVAVNDTLTRLGRHPDSDVFLDDITVSRRHSEIEHTPDGYVVRDVGSLNGTYLNQRRIEKEPLKTGDELQVGKFRLVFLEGPDEPS